MPLTDEQAKKVDEMTVANKKTADIVDELVASHGAKSRDVNDYLKENKTLQGMLKTITHRTKDIIGAGVLAERQKLAAEIESLAKKAIKIIQQKSKD
jgi:hypothetical protein